MLHLHQAQAMRVLVLSLVILGAGCARPKHSINPNDDTVELLPLAKGASWVYRVKTRQFNEAKQQDVEAYSEWKTEIVDVIPGAVTVYVVKGWPTDLAAFQGAPVASEKYLVRVDDTMLWGKTRQPTVDEAEGWFAEPLQEGQEICPDPNVTYCWHVGRKGTDWQLSMRTGPDDQTYVIRRGTGVVEYHYAHHGTTNEVTATLIGFTPGKSK